MQIAEYQTIIYARMFLHISRDMQLKLYKIKKKM